MEKGTKAWVKTRRDTWNTCTHTKIYHRIFPMEAWLASASWQQQIYWRQLLQHLKCRKCPSFPTLILLLHGIAASLCASCTGVSWKDPEKTEWNLPWCSEDLWLSKSHRKWLRLKNFRKENLYWSGQDFWSNISKFTLNLLWILRILSSSALEQPDPGIKPCNMICTYTTFSSVHDDITVTT